MGKLEKQVDVGWVFRYDGGMAIGESKEARKQDLNEFFLQFKAGAREAAGVVVEEASNKSEGPVEERSVEDNSSEKKKKGKKNKRNNKRELDNIEFETEEIETEVKDGYKKTIEEKLTKEEVALIEGLQPVVPLQKSEKSIDVESEEYKNASIEIYRALLMLGEVPFLDGFLVRGVDLSRVDKLDFCMESLVQHGVDTEMKLSTTMTGEEKEIKGEIKSKILDLRAYVLGVDKEINPQVKDWLKEIGVDEIRLKSIKESVDEKYFELFDEEEEIFKKKTKSGEDIVNRKQVEGIGSDFTKGIVTEESIDQKNKIANSDLRYQRSRLHYLGHRDTIVKIDEDGSLVPGDKEDVVVGKIRLVEDLLKLANGEGDMRDVGDRLRSVGVYTDDIKKLAEKAKPLYKRRGKLIEAFYENGSTEELEKLENEISALFSVDIIYQRILKGEKAHPKKEIVKKTEKVAAEVEKFPKYYDGLYEDLWVVENGTEDEKIISRERLAQNSIQLKQFSAEEWLAEFDYKKALTDIKKNNFVAWKNDKKNAENRIKEILNINSESNNDLDAEKKIKKEDVLWNQETFRQLYLGGFVNSKSEGQEALKVLVAKGIDLVKKIKELNNNRDDLTKASNAVWKLGGQVDISIPEDERQKLIETVKKYFSSEDVDGDNKAEIGEVNGEKEEAVEDREREKYLEYLSGGLLEDLKNIYPPFGTSIDGKVYSRSFHRLEGGNRLKRIWTKSTKKGFEGKDVRDFKRGQESIRLIEKFYAMDSGYPEDWNDDLMSEMVVGRSLEQFKKDLQEARKRKRGADKGGVEKGKIGERGKIKTETEEKRRKELVFDESEMLREFGDFVAVNGGRVDVWNAWMDNLEEVSEEKRREAIGQLKYTWDLLQNRDLRLDDSHFPFWQRFAMSYLRSLGVAGKV